MKTIKNSLLLLTALVLSFAVGSLTANALEAPHLTGVIGSVVFAGSLIPKAQMSFMTGVDVSLLTSQFVKFGGTILRKQVNSLMLGGNVAVYKNVKEPIAMPKLSAVGGPVPYSSADSTTGNGVQFTDRVLTVHQSKWDFDVDPEVYRNTYLADDTDAPFYQFILDQVGTEYMGAINDQTLYFGAYNAAGSTAAAIADGFVTKLKAEVTATNLTADAIGAITSANAVSQVEKFLAARPAWWREKDVVVKCSYATLDAYKANYRTINAFGFNKDENGQYKIDGWKNAILEPSSGLGVNNGLLGVVNKAMCFGTDGDRVQVAASMRRNIIEVRIMMPVGVQIADLACVAVSDVLVA